MATAECGCWEGPWLGINPPPKCDYHRGVRGARRRTIFGDPIPAPAPQPWTSNEIVFTTTTKPSAKPAPLSADDSVKALHAALLRDAAQAIESGDIARHDLIQLALQHLEPLRAAIERARKASK